MREETLVLRTRALGNAAFDEPVSSPIHGDLWFGNVLVDRDRWWIIDWDDLKIGDPAHDLSLILFTTLGEGIDVSRWFQQRDAAFVERFRLYCRAALLTFIVDPLADWITAEQFPAVRDQARIDRETLHRWALERYRQLYL
jgi:aminoglycoside phosphotransferase (APT) family kinase protein